MLITLSVAAILTILALLTLYSYGLKDAFALLFLSIEVFMLVMMAGASLVYLGPTLYSGALFVISFVLATLLVAYIFWLAFKWSLLEWLNALK